MNFKRLYCLTTILFLLSACGKNENALTTVSGYTPPKATPQNIQKVLEDAINELIFVEGGSFTPGCLDGKESLEQQVQDYINSDLASDQKFFFEAPLPCQPENKVSLDSFSMAKFENTFKDYDIFTQEAKLPFIAKDKFNSRLKLDKKDDLREGDKAAITGWYQANRYCDWLADKTGLEFSLPTDAQWEFAARSLGRNLPFTTDSGYWVKGKNYPTDNEENELIAKSTKYPPNPLGIYHMSGMKAEWVKDWFDGNTYNIKAIGHNPEGPSTGEKKILRGGGYYDSPQYHDVWKRDEEGPVWNEETTKSHIAYLKRNNHPIEYNIEDSRTNDHGFRCVVNHPKPITLNNLKLINKSK